MSEYVYAGVTSQTIDIFLQDSSSTTGQGLSGLVFNSAGLVASYRKGATGLRTAITLATQTVAGAYSSGGFVEIDATNMKGVYRLDLPNAMVDSEVFVTLFLYGATNLLPTALRIDCRALPVDVKLISGDSVAADNAEAFFDGTGYVGTGNVIPTVTTLTNLPAITANWLTAAGLAADAVSEIQTGLATPSNLTAATGVVLSGVTHTGAVIPTVSTLTGHTPQTGDSFARIGVAGAGLTAVDDTTLAAIAALINLSSVQVTAAVPTVIAIANEVQTRTIARVTLVDTCTTNTDMRGTDSAATAANLTTLKAVADKIATVIYGTVTGAGTTTEVFTGAGYTVTVTVDASGNRSSVVIT